MPGHKKDGSGQVFLQKGVLCERGREQLCVEGAVAEDWRDAQTENGEGQSDAVLMRSSRLSARGVRAQ